MKEVNAIPGALHTLNIPLGTALRTKIAPQSYNPSQRKCIEEKVDEMLAADIICPLHPSEVKFVSPTVLAQKTHKGQGLTLDKLKYCLNEQCMALGLPSAFEDHNWRPPPRVHTAYTAKNALPATASPKWHMCQDFSGVNHVTEVAPVPQGDIRAKQLHLSGHCYLHVFDFAAGFYGITVAEESQP